MRLDDLPWSATYLPERRVEVYDELPRFFVHQNGQWTEGGAPVDPDLAAWLEQRQPYNAELEALRLPPPV